LLPLGEERDALLAWARECEAAYRLQEWFSSPGLQPPE
jgi:hypothetical protein